VGGISGEDERLAAPRRGERSGGGRRRRLADAALPGEQQDAHPMEAIGPRLITGN
jgi:hypothetical protein